MNDVDLLIEYAKHIDPGRVRLLRNEGLAFIESRARGSYVWDQEGRRILDFRADSSSFNIGRRNLAVIRKIRKALSHYDLGHRDFFSLPHVELAKKLSEISPQKKLQRVTYGVSSKEVLTFSVSLAQAFTGRTQFIDASLMTSDRLQSQIGRKTAAVLFDPTICEPKTLHHLRYLCDKYGALLIVDETKSGLGRSGDWFIVNRENVVPDILCVGESLGGGIIPISACLYLPKYQKVLMDHPLFSQTMFGGSDLGCIAGLETLEFIERERLCERAEALGRLAYSLLETLKSEFPNFLEDFHGTGLLLTLKFSRKDLGPLISRELLKEGFLCPFESASPELLKLAPPLIITPFHISTFCEKLRVIFKRYSKAFQLNLKAKIPWEVRLNSLEERV